MPFLKAKKLGKLSQEKVLLELCRGFANSIRRLMAQAQALNVATWTPEAISRIAEMQHAEISSVTVSVFRW
jgi:hypothetical protein